MLRRNNQFTSWSFTRYTDYRQCPFKAKCKHIDKIAEPPNEAMTRGIKVHDDAKQYICGAAPKLSPDLKSFVALFNMLRKMYKKEPERMCVEETWAYTKLWGLTTWNDWVNCFLRIKLDCAYLTDSTLVLIDWKTGRFRREESQITYTEQLELYALAAFMKYGHILKVQPQLVYLDAGVMYPEQLGEVQWTRRDLPALKKTWAKRIQPMMNDKCFAPRANQFCNWCFYRKSNKSEGGGQCKY